jgi:murein DD-endopeptidase MepM/ murein hydrolase activator NlpD
MVATALLSASVPASYADRIGNAQERARVLREKLDALQVLAATAVGEFESIHEDLEQAVGEALSAQSSLSDARADSDVAHGTADDRVRAIYKSGGRTALYAAVLRAGNPHDLLARVANISAIVSVDAATVDNANVSERRAAAALAKYEKATVARQRLEGRAEAQTLEIERLMAAQEEMVANADGEVQALIQEQQLREEVARRLVVEAEIRRLAALALTTSSGDLTNPYQPAGGTYACPASAGNTFINSWHAPRSGGRLHQGTDIFAPYGSAAFAVTDGVVDKWGNGGLGGVTLWIRAANGDRFYYAHNSENLAPVGTVVHAGDVVALVGKSGNAASTPPHIHFEAHPGGGGAANPYPFLAAICGKR